MFDILRVQTAVALQVCVVAKAPRHTQINKHNFMDIQYAWHSKNDSMHIVKATAFPGRNAYISVERETPIL